MPKKSRKSSAMDTTHLLPPAGLPEIVFSFDTTGSMSGCIVEVKGRLQDMMQRLQADIPGIRIAVFAHGDYCDQHNYVTKYIDFSTNIPDLCNFVKNTGSTGGGDFEECYELVLREVQTELSWTPGSHRSLVMIGDATPHEPTYPDNKLSINWKEEVDSLYGMGVKIYSVQCADHTQSTQFYKHLADETGGKHIHLKEFTNIFDFLMAICYREHGAEFLQTYEEEVRGRYGGTGLHKDLEGMFGSLRPTDMDTSSSDAESSSEANPDKSSMKIATPTTRKTKVILKKSGSKLIPAGKPKKKRFYVPKLKAEKEKRENTSMAKFAYKALGWSSWQVAMSPTVPRGTKLWWEGRGEDRPGFRREKLFRGDFSKPAIYEFAVQPKNGGRRFVVYSKCSKGKDAVSSWEHYLLNRKDVQAQIDNVIESRCNIFVRRAIVSTTTAVRVGQRLMRVYDYAWRRVRFQRTSHRDVIKSHVSISSTAY